MKIKCVFYTYSTPQFGQASFQVVNAFYPKITRHTPIVEENGFITCMNTMGDHRNFQQNALEKFIIGFELWLDDFRNGPRKQRFTLD